MKRTFFSILVLSILAVAAAADAQSHRWSQRFGSTASDNGQSLSTDASGNVFVTGHFQGTVDFGGGPLVSAGARDIFLAKYGPTGTHLWSQRFGGTGDDVGNSLSTDPSGNVLVTGDFYETVDFGGGPLVSAGLNDIFIAMYGPAGTHLWSQRLGGTSSESGNSVAAIIGSVYVTGYFYETVDFGGGPLVSAGSSDIFVARYTNTGVHVSSQRFGGTADDVGRSIALNAAYNVFVTGDFYETVDFGGGPLVSAGLNDIFVARYGSSGGHVWSQRFGGTNNDSGQSLATDAFNNVFVTGRFGATADFGGGALVSAGSSDIFLARYSTNGVHVWSQRFGSASSDIGQSLATDASGNVFVTGYFSGFADFGGGPLVSAGAFDIFVANYDPSGAHLCSQRFGSTNEDTGYSVDTDASGNVFVTGRFGSTVDFGGGPLVSAGSTDIVLAKFAFEPMITSITDIGNDQGRKVKIRFSRAGYDLIGAGIPILQYEAYRRDDAAPAASGTWQAPEAFSERELLDDGWTQVGTVAAHGKSTYGIDVPTIGDSTVVSGQYYSTFFIRATTATPTTFYDSPPDSGYSVDNLAPGIPGSLLYNSGVLSWNESPAEDFDYFTVYGANADDFGATTVVDYTSTTDMDVTASPYAYYFVTATDFSGNEGSPAKINTLTGVGGTPKRYVLSVSNHPNPFNPRTTVKYTVPSRGPVTIAIYDAGGARVATLVAGETRDAGAYGVEWNGRRDNGVAVASGIYFASIVHNDAVRSKKMVLLK